MFNNRRRNPVLGTAIVIGASRASARREVERQSALQAQQQQQQQQQQMQQQQETERQAEMKKRQDEENEARIKKAVVEALEASKANVDSPTTAVTDKFQTYTIAGSSSGTAISARATSPFSLDMRGDVSPPPAAHLAVSPGQFGTPQNSPISPRSSLVSGVHTPKIHYCVGCGNGCDLTDWFC